MGKTAAGAVWLHADLLSPYDYWQFWRNTEDADVGRFLRLFTELPLAEIARLERLRRRRDQRGQGRARRRGDAACARRGGARGGGRNGAPRPSPKGQPATTCRRSRSRAPNWPAGVPAFELFRRAGLAASNGEARRLIKGGGARLNNVPLAEETRAVSLADADPTGRLKLSAGKKRHALVRIV